jgi:ribosome biogenesis GTPase / thiamine phosphate phosphatase
VKKSRRKYFQRQLEKLTEPQKRFLYKRAANVRKAEQVKNRSQRNKTRKEFNARGADETMIMFEKPQKVGSVSIDDWALKVIEEEGINFIIDNCPCDDEFRDYGQARQGIVVSSGAAECVVRCGGDDVDCLLGPELSMTQKSDIAIGDKVDFAFADADTAVVISVAPRKSKLSRPDPTRAGVERVVAANVDTAVIVAAIKKPLLRPSLIDRYLIAAEKGGIEPLICVNKIDLLKEADKQRELEVLEPYRQIGLPIVECSAATGFGLDELRDKLKGKLCVFVGHSGTGKSSVLNAMNPAVNIQTGEVHEATGLGRHTTTTSVLYEFGKDIRIIDTPGIREFGLWQMEPSDLKWYFDEFDEFAEDCKYANCSHTHEPDCAVKEAVEQGNITRQRYNSYIRILDTLTCD